jgi:hypothetical protein
MLERRTGLKRGKPLKRTAMTSNPQKTREWQDRSRQPLPKLSPRRMKLRKERREFVAFVLKHRPLCEARLPMCSGRSVDVNELQRGPGREDCWLDYDKVTSLCRGCHDWITNHGPWAIHHGHQLHHQGIITEGDWALAKMLREWFIQPEHAPRPRCVIDHRDQFSAWPPARCRDAA